jgi:hypothetical protein
VTVPQCCLFHALVVKCLFCKDNASFVVLQQVFFAENTVHLLVWDESDQTGLDEIEDTFQLIRVRGMLCF